MKNNTHGFTLAEVLTSVAIILVLAAIAMPSIFAIQKNMHMLELDNAAKQVAAAVQAQMTSEKVSGTWNALVESNSFATDDNRAKALAGNVSDAANTYYLTADQVQESGLLPTTAIDSVVRENDYVVEFNKNTATVCGVFYSDNKGSWFTPDNSAGTAALAYYDQADFSVQSREQKIRMANSTPIGYFGGMSAEATPEVALDKPIIWVDAMGKLCIQDPNLISQPNLKTSLEFTLSKSGKTVAFTVSGLQSIGNLYTISLPSSNQSISLVNKDLNKMFDLVAVGNDVPAIQSVYEIDLNSLKAALVKLTDANTTDIVTELTKFEIGDDVQVDANITTAQAPCIPATAQANVKWPSSVGLLRILVTNPRVNDDWLQKKGTYTSPKVTVTGSVPEAVNSVPDSKVFTIAKSEAVIAAQGNDKEEGRQSYSGLKMSLSEASVAGASIDASAGAYTKFGDSAPHQYQICEIWVNGALVGSYGSDGIWVWHDSRAVNCFAPNVSRQPGLIDETTKSVKVDAVALAGSGISLSNARGYDVYVRTAPALAEMRKYLTSSGFLGFAGLYYDAGKITARGYDETSNSAIAQSAIKSVFGCPTSVALWSIEKKNIFGKTDATGFNKEDIYIYYALTPFNPSVDPDASKGETNTLTCSVMWRLAAKSTNPLTYTTDDYTSFAQNKASRPDWNWGSAPDKAVISKTLIPNSVPGITSDIEVDFAIPTNAETDMLYYRTLTYQQDAAVTPMTKWQWAPLYSRNLATMQPNNDSVFFEGENKNEKETFVAWNTEIGGTGDSFEAQANIFNSSGALSLGPAALYAQYTQPVGKEPGLMYLEFTGKEVTGWYGYLSKYSFSQNLPDNNTINTWGYYVITASGREMPTGVAGSPKLDEAKQISVILNGEPYDAYPVSFNDNEKLANQKVSYQIKNNHDRASYTINFNFAAAVTTDDAGAWGKANAPWRVRHAAQFPMALLWWPPNPQSVYMEDYFKQEHGLDMSVVTASSNLAGSTFKGSYDGGNYPIENFYARFIGETAYKTSESNTYHVQGLFPSTQGAALRNIRLINESSVTHNLKPTLSNGVPNNVDITFGCLVGVAEGGSIENCTVEAKETLSIDITDVNANTLESSVGGLVGRAIGTTLSGVRVSNVELSVTPKAGQVWNMPIPIGGLIGVTSAGSLTRVSASDIMLKVGVSGGTEIRGKAVSSFGGLIGRVQGSSPATTIKEGNANKIVFIAPDAQSREKIYAGGCVGTADAAAIFEASFSNISLVYQSTSTPIDKLVGSG